MRALSIRQPYAELILRGIKNIDYRSRRTRAEACSETSYASCDMKLLGNIFSTASILILVFSHILTPLLCNFV